MGTPAVSGQTAPGVKDRSRPGGDAAAGSLPDGSAARAGVVQGAASECKMKNAK
jgi:hypothetical protein